MCARWVGALSQLFVFLSCALNSLFLLFEPHTSLDNLKFVRHEPEQSIRLLWEQGHAEPAEASDAGCVEMFSRVRRAFPRLPMRFDRWILRI
jgi:hypothetical protein